MYQVESYTISETQKSIDVPLQEWKFQIENGNTGEVIISDPLLETEALAQERAMAEFVSSSYGVREVNFKTYLTDFEINDIINVRGLPYIIKNILVEISEVSIVNSIRAVRYE